MHRPVKGNRRRAKESLMCHRRVAPGTRPMVPGMVPVVPDVVPVTADTLPVAPGMIRGVAVDRDAAADRAYRGGQPLAVTVTGGSGSCSGVVSSDLAGSTTSSTAIRENATERTARPAKRDTGIKDNFAAT